MTTDLLQLFGSTDIYLLDQLLRGRISSGMRILDVGCGGGRNLRYFLASGYEVFASDPDAGAIDAVRRLALELAPEGNPSRDPDHYRSEGLERGTFSEGSMDVVVCNAVLHFAKNADHFHAMLAGAWRPLRAGGVFFSRLASSIGIEDDVLPLGSGSFRLPDGTQRFLVDEDMLLAATEALGGALLDPIKTTNVQGLRCMTTWVMRKA